MCDKTDIEGPVRLAPETRLISAATAQRVRETLALRPAGPTLIDQMSDADFLAEDEGDIRVGIPRNPA